MSDDPDEPTVVVPLAYQGLDPCSWEQWKPDDGCDGGWPGTGASAFAHIIGLGPLQVADSVEMPSGSSVHRVPHIRIVSRTPPTAPVEAEARIRVDGALGGTASPEAYLGRE